MNRAEKALMKTIYLNATVTPGKNECTMSDLDLLTAVPFKIQLLPENLEEHIKSLALQDYFLCDYYDKKGSRYYAFSLLNKGKSYIKEIESEKRAIKFKIALTIFGSIASFIIGRILVAVFS